MKGIAKRVLIATLALAVISAPAAVAKTSADKADARILIDVSGSMKKNDPKNLRRPALRLLVGLLSSETRAGVWTFGQYVNMQIPLGQVDKAWKQKARKSSKSIGSPGQFTNIEDALKRSTEDWSGPPGPYRRSVILLTDGMVDISKDKKKNAASKQRILKQILPRLKQHQVTVHTIALSKNADHELMQELAGQTGGWYEQTETADQLQKVFLRIFEKVGKPDSVPLKDNKFTIDPSITEATLLIFHKPGAKPTEVLTPEGQSFNADNAPANVSWHRDEGYDMLTISDPKSGEWRIRAEADPDNRVMVVTDLKMVTTDLPNRIIHGSSLDYQVSFTDHGKTISKQEFLQKVNIAASRSDILGDSEPRPLADDGRVPDAKAGDGYFTMSFGGEALNSGVGELIINARGATFNRERRTTYQVVPPVEMNLQPREDGKTLDLQLSADAKLIEPGSLQLEAWLEDQSGNQQPLALHSSSAGGEAVGVIDLMGFSGSRKVTLKAQARTLDGAVVDYIDSPAEVEGMKP
ncbi:MAG: vWA domain-containing protein, partial [Candidatus Thiodiazotropha taylori]